MDYLGGDRVAGHKMKEIGTSRGSCPQKEETNESGFSALPSGYRNLSGIFLSLGKKAYFWTSSEQDALMAPCRNLHYPSGCIKNATF